MSPLVWVGLATFFLPVLVLLLGHATGSDDLVRAWTRLVMLGLPLGFVMTSAGLVATARNRRRTPALSRRQRVALVVLLILHLAFVIGGIVEYLALRNTGGQGDMFLFLITLVLGFPWLYVIPYGLFIGPFVNYALLWWVTWRVIR